MVVAQTFNPLPLCLSLAKDRRLEEIRATFNKTKHHKISKVHPIEAGQKTQQKENMRAQAQGGETQDSDTNTRLKAIFHIHAEDPRRPVHAASRGFTSTKCSKGSFLDKEFHFSGTQNLTIGFLESQITTSIPGKG